MRYFAAPSRVIDEDMEIICDVNKIEGKRI
jgi:hypothetical protein